MSGRRGPAAASARTRSEKKASERAVDIFTSYSPQTAAPRVRVGDWLRHLGIPGVWHSYAGLPNARARTLLANPWDVMAAEVHLRRTSTRSKRIIVSREATPLGIGEVEKRLLADAAYAAFDFDDAIFIRNSVGRRIFDCAKKFRRMIPAADVVIAGNDNLAEVAGRYSQRVRVIPSCVEPAQYLPKSDWGFRGEPVVVWLGSPWTEEYLLPILPAMAEVNKRTGAVLHVISAPRGVDEVDAWPFVKRIPWSPDRVAADLLSADLAIAPLTDTPYARGKCAYKLLEYAATGLPIVGSPVGANAAALERFDGIAVGQPDDWADALLMVIGESSSRRAERGARGLRMVQQHYSFDAWEDAWRQAALGES